MPDSFPIEIRNKAAVYGVRYGYVMRGTAAPSAIVIHTTNNAHLNTTFDKELAYLFDSADVSAHFLVGKDGRIVQLLDPRAYAAYHAGGKQSDGSWTALPAFANPNSIGIELHVSVGERPTGAQLAATGWLVKRLSKQFTIPDQLIETHRAVALPKGRKSDPEGWPDAAFAAWRAALFAPPPPPADGDPFAAWGDVAKPEGEQRGWAIPRAWLHNQWLGRCLQGETWFAPGVCSAACFTRGAIVYEKASDTARVVPFT